MDIKKYVEGLELGKLQVYKNLTIAPILGEDSDLEHIVLADAIKEGFEIREKGSATVPTLYAVNKTGKNVLAIAGEYVVGGKQNRTLDRNIYFDKNFEGDIPVRCIQQGRWGSESIDLPRERVFRSAGIAPLSVSMFARSQGETWNAISHFLADTDVRSASSDFNEIYRHRRQEFDKFRENFEQLDKQIGNVAIISKNGVKLYVLDLFDRQEILEKHYANLVNSYTLEAGLGQNSEVKVTKKEVKDFLDSLNSCNFSSRTPISLGEDYRISGKLEGNALTYENVLVYMNLFTRPKGIDTEPTDRIHDVERFGLETGFQRDLSRIRMHRIQDTERGGLETGYLGSLLDRRLYTR